MLWVSLKEERIIQGGNIIIPKEAGEGLFGISFKMKGLSGNIKTTINPIRTLTPRFIQKIVQNQKKSK